MDLTRPVTFGIRFWGGGVDGGGEDRGGTLGGEPEDFGWIEERDYGGLEPNGKEKREWGRSILIIMLLG